MDETRTHAQYVNTTDGVESLEAVVRYLPTIGKAIISLNRDRAGIFSCIMAYDGFVSLSV